MVIAASSYYLNSIKTLLINFNWWTFPLLFFKKPILIRIKNKGSFYVSNAMDIWTLKEVIVDQQYEKTAKIKKGDIVVDIGAAIGDFSIMSATKAKKVIAYECDRERLSLMKKNMKRNHATAIDLRPVKATSLKQILNGVRICDFFKIDCEGGEYSIFRNATSKDLSKLKHIAMEAHKFDSTMKKEYLNLLAVLKKNKFKVKIVKNPVHANICYLYAKR